MSESQQGPEICDVISRKRYYSLETSLSMPMYLMLKFADISWGKIQIFCRPAYIYMYRVYNTNISTSKMIVLFEGP